MQIHLYCPTCLAELTRIGRESGIESIPPILSDVYELLNDGVYTVHCTKGHVGKVVLCNLNFELLYDLGINAIGDGYYKEAVTSITSSLERFYEFFIKTIWRVKGLDFSLIDSVWKELSSQSERQFGAYIAAYSFAFGAIPPYMSNKQKSFRNNVIHKGEIPTREKTVKYAGEILEIIEGALNRLKENYFDTVKESFNHYVPHYEPKDPSENFLTINHPTIIRTNEPFQKDQKTERDIETLISLVLQARKHRRMWLINESEKKQISVDYEQWLAKRIRQNQDNGDSEYHVVIDPNETVDVFLDKLGEQLEEYDGIFSFLHEDQPELFQSDMLTIALGNTQLLARLYFLYSKVKLYQILLNNCPNDQTLKEKYDKSERELEEYHKNLTYFE